MTPIVEPNATPWIRGRYNPKALSAKTPQLLNARYGMSQWHDKQVRPEQVDLVTSFTEDDRTPWLDETYWVFRGFYWGLYRDHGEENGNYGDYRGYIRVK